MPWRKATIDSDGVRLSVRDSGGRGRPLLLVHGLGLTQRSWGRVAHRLETRFRVVTYDQRGHGASARATDYSRSALLRDLEVVASELALRDFVLVGHSLGGHLAVEYAAAHPDCAGVVGVEGGVPVDLPAADWVRLEAATGKVVADIAMAVMRLLRLGSALSFEEMKRLAEQNEQWLRELGAAYDRMSCPVMLVLGARADRVPQGPRYPRGGAARCRGPAGGTSRGCGGVAVLRPLDPPRAPAELAAKIGQFTDSLD
jgi:pimeloyl-ACP methyl ester carboxylesterase